MSSLNLYDLLYKNSSFNKYELYKNDLEAACYTNNLEKCKLLTCLTSSIDISKEYESLFEFCCNLGHLDIAKWLLEIKPSITSNIASIITKNNNRIFYSAFTNGDIEMLKWLFNIQPDNDVFYHIQNFFGACENGYFSVVKWLIDIDIIMAMVMDIDSNLATDLKFDANMNEAFAIACSNGHLEIAQFLLEFQPTIKSFNNDHESFKNACDNGYIEVAKWLASLDSRYIIINYDGKISYTIMKRFILNRNIIKVDEIDVCTICKENDIDIQTNCKHHFCTSCICSWLIITNTCPFCRQTIDCLNKIKFTENN